MQIGIGIPSTIPGATRTQLLESARRADAIGFSSLGAIDRLVYPNYEPLVALAAAAAVTERARLTTAVLIAPNRINAALLAKQAASIQTLSEGRLVIGAALGARADDYEASGITTKARGKRFDDMLEEMNKIWAGEPRGFEGPVGPVPETAPPVLIGGTADAAFARAARHGSGWIAGGGTADGYDAYRAKMYSAWEAAGREGEPRMLAMAYCSLGRTADADADAWIGSYYGFAGPYAETVRVRTATTAVAIREMVKAYADQGCEELILFPCSPDPDQVDILADVTL